MNSARFWIALGALSASIAVAAGAIGTHVLKESLELPESELATYDLAVRYQMTHSLGLILAGLLMTRCASRLLTFAAAAMVLGIVLFSGGLYGWLFTGQTPFVHVVPVGGSAWILAWLMLAAGAIWGRWQSGAAPSEA